MRYMIVFGFLFLLGSCSSNKNDAIICRGGRHLSKSISQVKTVILVQADGLVISTSPLRCPNMIFRFVNPKSQLSLQDMSDISKRSALGKSTFEMDAKGFINVNKDFGILQLNVLEVKQYEIVR